jgi:imidazolonepropionase-like amidohydrolase
VNCNSAPSQPATRKEASAQPAQEDVRQYVKVDAPVIALVHATIIDGSGEPPRRDQTLVIERGIIKTIGDANKTVVPPDATALDLRGYTLIPGLVGMHNHLFYSVEGGKQFETMRYSFPRLYLACGVTSIRTAGAADWIGDKAIKKDIDEGKQPGPKIHLTSPYLSGNFDALQDPTTQADFARRWIEEGATSLKAAGLRSMELAAVIGVAHERGIKVTGHLGAVGFGEAIAAGIDNLEHGLLMNVEFCSNRERDKPADWGACVAEFKNVKVGDPGVQHVITDLVNHKVAVTSTLSVLETLTDDGFPLEQRVVDALSPEAQRDFLEHRRQAKASKRELWISLLKLEMSFERAFVKGGGLLMAGVDPTGWGGVLPGFGDQRNLELLVEAGFSVEEAIRIATKNGAEFLGESERIGILREGKQADIVVIRGNLSHDIAEIKKVELVFKDGVGYDSGRLIESVRRQVGKR